MRYLVLGLAAAVAVFALWLFVLVSSAPKPPTPQELRAFPEVDLKYPGAVEVRRFDTLGRYGLLNDHPTMVGFVYESADSPEEVEAWYGVELSTTGWLRKPDLVPTGGGPPNHRWCHPSLPADFVLVINDEGEDRERFPADQFAVSLRSERGDAPCEARPN